MLALENEVKLLNSRYCTRKHNHLVIINRFGLTKVVLTGKNANEGLKTKMFGITNDFTDPLITLKNLKACEECGWLREVIAYKEQGKIK